MADISAEIAAFKNAVYGEDVRDAMVSLANKLNVITSSEEMIVNQSENAYYSINSQVAGSDIYVEPTENNGFYIQISGSNTLIRGKNEGGINLSSLSLVTSPEGVSDCVLIPNFNCLYIDKNNKAYVGPISNTNVRDIVLIHNYYGRILCGSMHSKIKNRSNVISFITSGYYEKNGTTVYLKYTYLSIYGSVKYGGYLTVESLISLTTSPKNVSGCIQINTGYAYIFRPTRNRCMLISVESIRNDDVILLANYDNRIDGTLSFVNSGDKSIQQNNIAYDTQFYLREAQYIEIDSQGREDHYYWKPIPISDTLAYSLTGPYNPTIEFSDFVFGSSITLVTSPLGVENCINIPYGKFVYYDLKTNKIESSWNMAGISNYSGTYNPRYVLLAYNSRGKLRGVLGERVYARQGNNKSSEYSSVNFTNIYFEPHYDNEYVYLFFRLSMRGGSIFNWDINGIIDHALNYDVQESDYGYPNCIKLLVGQKLCYDPVIDKLFIVDINNPRHSNNAIVIANYNYYAYSDDCRISGPITSFCKTYTNILDFNDNAKYIIPTLSKSDAVQHTIPVFTLLHLSDIHGGMANMARYTIFKKYFKNFIQDSICTGDLVGQVASDGMDFWDKTSDKTMLTVIGNHDMIASSTYDESQLLSQAETYNRYILPYKDLWVQNNTEVHTTTNLTYYYKDYKTYKIRLISLNCMLTSTEKTAQETWLANTLSSVPSDYGVICCLHYRHNLTLLDTNFRSTSAEVIGGTSDYISQVEDFIDNGGEFICWLTGHWHSDNIGVVTGTNQVEINLGTSRETTNNNGGYEFHKSGTKAQDLFNVMAIDRTNKLITILRIGNDHNNSDPRFVQKRGMTCIDYGSDPATVLYNN